MLTPEGCALDGHSDGFNVRNSPLVELGNKDGIPFGAKVEPLGETVEISDDSTLGAKLGCFDGSGVGCLVGLKVGSPVGAEIWDDDVG